MFDKVACRKSRKK